MHAEDTLSLSLCQLGREMCQSAPAARSAAATSGRSCAAITCGKITTLARPHSRVRHHDRRIGGGEGVRKRPREQGQRHCRALATPLAGFAGEVLGAANHGRPATTVTPGVVQGFRPIMATNRSLDVRAWPTAYRSGMTLTADEALATTRAVRRRLDLDRPVARDLVDECLRLAVQAPTSEGNETWHFVVIEDAATRAEIA